MLYSSWVFELGWLLLVYDKCGLYSQRAQKCKINRNPLESEFILPRRDVIYTVPISGYIFIELQYLLVFL